MARRLNPRRLFFSYRQDIISLSCYGRPAPQRYHVLRALGAFRGLTGLTAPTALTLPVDDHAPALKA